MTLLFALLVPLQEDPAVPLENHSGDTAPNYEAANLRYRLWFATLGGTVSASRPAVDGTDVRLTTDLDLTQSEVLHDWGGSIRISDYGDLRLNWVFGSFEGSERLGQTIAFAGISFAKGSTVSSEVSLHLITALYEHEMWGPDELGADAAIWLQVGGKFISASTQIESNVSSAEGSLTGFLPVVGARGAIALSPLFRVEAELGGMILPLGDRAASLFDITLEIALTPWGGLSTGLGYHFATASVLDESQSDEEEEATVALGGLTFFAGWRF